MKKIFSMLLALAISLSLMPAVFANDISVYVNNVKLYSDVPPMVIDGRTMVPMRMIFEALGAEVDWDPGTQTATGRKDGDVVNITIGSKVLIKNGTPFAIDVPAVSVDSRTLVPVRAISESLDCQVSWDGNTQSVYITTDGEPIPEKKALTASQISDRVSPGVFYLEVYDEEGYMLGSGSGFFIDSDGTAVTNYHVIEDTYSARIVTTDGKTFDVTHIIAYDIDLDIAIIKVDKTTIEGKRVAGFYSLTLGNSDNIRAGQTVYALGSPVGLQNTISNGIISNVNQYVDGESFIQITAPISHGSSGGALVNEYGEVIGVTSAGITDAQNIGFVIPINVLSYFDLDAEGFPYDELQPSYDDEYILEVYPENIDIEVGEVAVVYVYAVGPGDWSIYWDNHNEYVTECEWGDWLDEDPDTCPLYITGLEEGYSTVKVYSDYNTTGYTIPVRVRAHEMDCYYGTNVPTYTYVTGRYHLEFDEFDSSYFYSYDCYDVYEVQDYVNFITSCGFELYEEEELDDSMSYYYTSPDGEVVAIILPNEFDEVWIMYSK